MFIKLIVVLLFFIIKVMQCEDVSSVCDLNQDTIQCDDQEISSIPSYFLSGLSVNSVYLAFNKIETINPDAFKNASSVVLIELSNNQIKYISNELFLPIKSSLNELMLSNNNLNLMNTNDLGVALNHASNLNKLCINQNGLVILPNLRANNHLQELELNINNLTTLFDANESLLPNSLVRLHLEKNVIKNIELEVFKHLKNLKTLNLNYNQIETLDKNVFSYLANLEDLQLKTNWIKQIPNDLLLNLPHLINLDISCSRYDKIELREYVFDTKNKTHGIKINLNENNILFLDKLVFCSRDLRPANISYIELSLIKNDILSETNVHIFSNLNRTDKYKTQVSLNIDCNHVSLCALNSIVELSNGCSSGGRISGFNCDTNSTFNSSDEYNCYKQPQQATSASTSTPTSTSTSTLTSTSTSTSISTSTTFSTSTSTFTIMNIDNKIQSYSTSNLTSEPVKMLIKSSSSMPIINKSLICATFFIVFTNSLF